MTPPKLTYTQAVEEVERILKRAAELIRLCREKLRKAEQEVSEALKEE